MRKDFCRRGSTAVLILFLLLGLAGCGGSGQPADKAGTTGGTKVIRIGAKNFTENILLGELMAQLIEAKTDLIVERQFNLGGTLITFNALKEGQLDLYPEYTGTALIAIMKHETETDPDKVWNIVKDEFAETYKLEWLEPFGLNNTYVVGVRAETAQKYNLQKISDLAPVAKDMVFGGTHEFFNRPDGYPGLERVYGLRFKDTKAMDHALKYTALANRQIDAASIYNTDSQMIKYNVVALEDDKHLYPPYHAAPLVRQDVLAKYHELAEVLNGLGGQITDEEMRQLNYQVDIEGKDLAAVAKEYLQRKGLI